MLSLQFIRENVDRVRQGIADKNIEAPLDELLTADDRRRQVIAENEGLKARRNEVSRQIGKMKERPAELIEEMRTVGDRIKRLDEEQRELDARVEDLLLRIPNVPHPSVPVGKDEGENVPLREWGDHRQFDFTPKPHWEIAEALGILDTARATRMSGARFVLLKGAGAALERALINWMIDVHVNDHGYLEIAPPFLVERKAMVGTGQLPKFEEDAYRTDDDLFLIPTAEVPVTNMHREEILDAGTLPRNYVAYTPCFRREAGSAGRDTRGLTRVHQFDKVEMVKIVEPDRSYDELESLLGDAEDMLQRLGLPYRVLLMCTGDLGFTQTKKYDPEVWCPGQDRYVEISSCSNFETFQARRARIQYRPSPTARADYPHTLNGSGLAVGRTLAAILENYQHADGSVIIPEVLRPYLGGRERIEAK